MDELVERLNRFRMGYRSVESIDEQKAVKTRSDSRSINNEVETFKLQIKSKVVSFIAFEV